MHKLQKPLFILEIGIANDPRKAVWIKDFLKKECSDYRVTAFIYFNYGKHSKSEPTWILHSDSITQIFKNWIQKKGKQTCDTATLLF